MARRWILLGSLVMVSGLSSLVRADDWFGQASGQIIDGGYIEGAVGAPCGSCGGNHPIADCAHRVWHEWVVGRRFVRMSGTPRRPLPLLTGPAYAPSYKMPPIGSLNPYTHPTAAPADSVAPPATDSHSAATRPADEKPRADSGRGEPDPFRQGGAGSSIEGAAPRVGDPFNRGTGRNP